MMQRFSGNDARARGCDHWFGSSYCGEPHVVVDEVDDSIYCQLHAGPLAWSARDVNLYSLALRVAAKSCSDSSHSESVVDDTTVHQCVGVLYQMPATLRDRLYPSETRAA